MLDAQAVFRGLRHCAQLQVDAMPWTGRDVVVRDGISVADLDPGLGAFLTPGSGIRDGRKSASGSGIRDEQPGSYFLEL